MSYPKWPPETRLERLEEELAALREEVFLRHPKPIPTALQARVESTERDIDNLRRAIGWCLIGGLLLAVAALWRVFA